jgi:TetR/AcrR family transcriptional regulator, tetracycline repressor protein
MELAMDEKKISRETILREALALLKEAGLDGMSLRVLAARVGVRAPSLYWYFKDKNALLDGLVEDLFSTCLDAVPDHRHWRDWMRAFGKELLRTQLEIPDFGRLGTTRDMAEDHFDRTVKRLRERLEKLDMPLDEAVKLQSAVQALTTGWSAFTNAPYAGKLRRLQDLDAVAAGSLDALIQGWTWDTRS